MNYVPFRKAPKGKANTRSDRKIQKIWYFVDKDGKTVQLPIKSSEHESNVQKWGKNVSNWKTDAPVAEGMRLCFKMINHHIPKLVK